MEEKQIRDGISFDYNPSNKTLVISPETSGANIALPDYGEEEGMPWAEYAEEVEMVVLEDGITDIGNSAFEGWKALQSVTIKSATLIGDRAFCECEKLIRVMIESSAISIGKETFKGCEKLKRVMARGRVTSIGDRAFSGCKALYRLMRPDSVERNGIGEKVLDQCTYISGVLEAGSVDMDEAMKRIWAYYEKAAEVFGLQRDRAENDEKQGNSSLWWFYLEPNEKNREENQFNNLMKTFLGDENAKKCLQWDEKLPDWDIAEDYLKSLPDEKLNKSQKEAIEVALKNPISFIQGPPGTGKTTMILQLVTCMALMNQDRKKKGEKQLHVAIVSTNVSALDAIHEKKSEFEERTGYRLARLGNQEARGTFNQKHAEQEKNKKDDEKNPIKFQTKIKPERFWTASGKIEKRWRESNLESRKFLGQYPIFTTTIHSLKCLFNDSRTLQYDYVIMDEVSQVDVVKGLIAMSCAKHLVLVGDEEQLSPVLPPEKILRVEEEWKEEGNEEIETDSDYKIDEDKSFLDRCLSVFRVEEAYHDKRRIGEIEVQNEGKAKRVKVKEFLNEHHRCLRGIIEFCNLEIYGGDLRIMTGKDPGDKDAEVPIPIKVLWYEGDYCERRFYTDATEGQTTTKHNVKQCELFMREEWEKLLERMESGEISNFSILSPFKGQIETLRERVEPAYEKYKKEKGEDAIKLSIYISTGKQQEENTADDGYKLSVSTVHKSQGKEFDIVYFLPTEDDRKEPWEWPWSQKKRLVNVAVSRAKKELRVIASTSLMSAQVRKFLLNTEEKEVLEGQGKAEGEEALKGQGKAGDLFVQKLVDYVYDPHCYEYDKESGKKEIVKIRNNYEKDYEEGFRFHQAKCVSIFDMGKKEKKENPDLQQGLPDPEAIVAAALKKMPVFQEKELIMYHDVKIRNLQMPSGETVEEYLNGLSDEDELKGYQEYVCPDEEFGAEFGAEFDIVVCRKSGEVLMAVEVDGLWHRFDQERETLAHQQERDDQKDKLAEHLLKAACYKGNRSGQGESEKAGSFVFLRLPCDGSTALESKTLCAQKEEELKKGFITDGELREWEKLREKFITMDELLEREVEKDRSAGSYKVQPEFMLVSARELAYSQYNSFKRFIVEKPMSKAKRHSLEEVRKLSYKTTAAPDYSDIHVQERYLLSYFSAYACEYLHVYRKMYEKFQDWDFCGKQIEVTSLGCGNMVDYWGLAKAAMETYGSREALIHYIGVDAADWKRENLVPRRGVDNVKFVRDRAESYLEKQTALTSDVYVFPKSLSEYKGKKKDFNRICKVFEDKGKRFTKDEVCILTVFRSNSDDVEEQKKDNQNYCEELKKAIEKKGFHSSYDKIWGIKEGRLKEKEGIKAADEKLDTRKIWDTDRCFQYGESLCGNKGKITMLLEKAEEEMERAGLQKKEVRNPISNTYWCCRVMVFKRN